MSADEEPQSMSRRTFLKKSGGVSLYTLSTMSIPSSLSYIDRHKITRNVQKAYRDTTRHVLSDDISVNYEAGAIMTAAGVGSNLALKHVYGIKEPVIQTGTSAAAANTTAFSAGLDTLCEDIWVDTVARPSFANSIRGVLSLFSDVSFFSNHDLVNTIFENEDVVKKRINESETELVLPTLNAETGKISYHSSVDDNYFFDSLKDIVLSNLAEPITYGRNVPVETSNGVEPCFDAFYGETMVHKYHKMEGLLNIFVASRTEKQIQYSSPLKKLKRKIREQMSLRNTRYEAKEKLIRTIQETSIRDRKEIESQPHNVLIEPQHERSKTNTKATYISTLIKQGFLETVASRDLQRLTGIKPDMSKAYEVVQR